MTAEDDPVALAAALKRVAAGEETALRLVYDRTSARLFGVCLRILKSEREAEDVLQDVYLAVWRKAASFDETRAAAPTWLAALARNLAIDRLRAAAGRLHEPAAPAVEAEDPAQAAGADLRRLRRRLNALEPQQAAAVRTAFFEGLTYEALARRMQASPATVRAWVRQSLTVLREDAGG